MSTLGSTGASSQEKGAAEWCLEFGHVPADPLNQRPPPAVPLAAEGVFGVPGVSFEGYKVPGHSCTHCPCGDTLAQSRMKGTALQNARRGWMSILEVFL